jgi:L,D-transpeptidase ErfK/SrfK
VNQPYLVGQRNGVLYMEVHTPLEDSGFPELEKINEKLRSIERKSGRKLDWKKIKEAQAEARGIPVPIFEMSQGNEKEAVKTIEVEHPYKLYGKPEIPELNMKAWNVLAADVREETDALRLAAIINHQGPQIPAGVVSKNDSYRVIAGPFNDIGDARAAIKRLKIDLDMDGILIEPVRK